MIYSASLIMLFQWCLCLEWISSTKSHMLVPTTCFLQTTDWTPCSATCGMGVSSRVTNSNAKCRLVKETRLCQIRECGSTLLESPLKVSKEQRKTSQHHVYIYTLIVHFSRNTSACVYLIASEALVWSGVTNVCTSCTVWVKE